MSQLATLPATPSMRRVVRELAVDVGRVMRHTTVAAP